MIGLTWNNDLGTADVARDGGNIITDPGLETAVVLSLFTDRQAEDDATPLGDGDRRGWWADAYSDGDKIGSRLWLLSRSKVSDDTLAAAKRYCDGALAWLVTDGIAKSVVVEAWWLRSSVLCVSVAITKPNDPGARWSKVWEVHVNGV